MKFLIFFFSIILYCQSLSNENLILYEKIKKEKNKANLNEKRYIYFNEENDNFFPNIIRNQKYSILSLIPLVLFNQFSLFSNQFYLLMAVSQFFDALKVGFLFSYVAPLVFVLLITLIKEAYDDYKRYLRDKEANNQKYL